MRVLVVYAHPHPESFCHAALERVLAGLAVGGHEVDVLDLYAEGFNPVIDAVEWKIYMNEPARLYDGAPLPEAERARMKRHLELVRRAEGLVFVYPTWLFSLPAMLKGWLDRMFIPGVSFSLPEGDQRAPESLLRRIRLVAAVTSTGTPWWLMAASGSPGKRLLRRAIRLGFALRCQNVWLCLHSMETNTPAQRARHLDRGERRFARIR